VPTPVWGRDELDAGEMWNSNSLISWLIARNGLDAEAIKPPVGGRAPGWDAGLVVARRDKALTFRMNNAMPPTGIEPVHAVQEGPVCPFGTGSTLH
jgi:hypothetical protein